MKRGRGALLLALPCALLCTRCAAAPPAVAQVQLSPPPLSAPPPLPAPPGAAAAAAPVESSPTPAAAPDAAPSGPGAVAVATSDAEALAIARSVCPAAIQHDDGKVRVGCRACPPFGPGSAPDGQVVSDPATFYPIEGVYPGSFTAPGVDQRAVVFAGCEPHSANYGGTLLVDVVSPGVFRAAGYYSGVHPQSCRPYRRPDGRDLLVCTWSDVHQGEGYEQLFSFDFAAAPPGDTTGKGWTELVTVHRNAFAACHGMPPQQGLRQGRILGFRFEEHAGEKAPRIVVELEHRFTPYSPAVSQAVKKACEEARAAGREPVIDAPAVLGAPRKETVELVFDGRGFVPTARSRAVLRGL